MDYTISNNARLFDELLKVLNDHQREPGVVEAIDDLQAAQRNYVNRSIDHMLSCLVLTIHNLIVHPPSEGLRKDIGNVINAFYHGTISVGSRLSDLAHEYERQGGQLLSRDEILKELDERRGTAH